MRRCAQEIQPPFSVGMCFYGVGDHGGGPTRKNLETIRRLNREGQGPELMCSRPEAYFEAVQEHTEKLPVVKGELQHHASGCYSAHSGVKRWNRLAENRLLMAEKFAAIADLMVGQPYPDDFSQAWKAVLFNQFHDVLAGTSLEVAYEDARNFYGQALSISEHALTFAVQSLAQAIHIPVEENSQPIIVFNPHAWAVRYPIEVEYRIRGQSILRDEAGNLIPIQRLRPAATADWRGRLGFIVDLPPLGYRVYHHVQPDETAVSFPELEAGDNYIENEFLRLEVDVHTGCISRLYDKRCSVDVFAGPAARPVVLDDLSDTWSHGVFRFDREIGSFTAHSLQLVERGAVKATLRLISEYGSSRLVQDFSLYAQFAWVEVKVRVDWHEQHKMLKLRFPVNVQQARVMNEIAYGAVQRLADGDEEPMQSWVDISGFLAEMGEPYGLSLLNDGKYSFDARQADLGFTILRSPIYAHHAPAMPQSGELYDYMDQGQQKFTYRLLPHRGSWLEAGTAREAAVFNQHPVALMGTFHPQGRLPQMNSFVSAEPASIIVSVLKKAEQGDDLILRACQAGPSSERAVIHLPFLNRVLEADFGPWEIKTFRIPRQHHLLVKEVNLLEWDAFPSRIW